MVQLITKSLTSGRSTLPLSWCLRKYSLLYKQFGLNWVIFLSGIVF